MVYSADLLNQYTCKGIMGSNPILTNELNGIINNNFYMYKLKKNINIIKNQLRCKLLIKNLYLLNFLKSIRVNINLNKLKSFNDVLILEGLFLLEFLTSLKTSISYFKKMYQEVNIQLSTVLRKKYIFYLIYILKIFYFPLLLRRNESLAFNFDNLANCSLTVTNVTMLPFLPDVYFKWNLPINCFFQLDTKNINTSYLYLSYWNFPITNK